MTTPDEVVNVTPVVTEGVVSGEIIRPEVVEPIGVVVEPIGGVVEPIGRVVEPMHGGFGHLGGQSLATSLKLS